jgi:hypothetical protein
LDPGSEIRDPGSGMGKNQDPGSGINILDPQHCLQIMVLQWLSCMIHGVEPDLLGALCCACNHDQIPCRYRTYSIT